MKRLGDDAADEWVFGARRPAAAAGSRLVLVVSRRTRRRQVAFDVGRSAHGGACRDVTNTTLASQCAPLRGRAKQPRVWAKSASSVPQGEEGPLSGPLSHFDRCKINSGEARISVGFSRQPQCLCFRFSVGGEVDYIAAGIVF